MVLLNITQNIQEWGSNPGYIGLPPDDVKSIYRLLGTLRHLGLIKSGALFAGTSRLKVARLVIKKLLE